VDVFRALAPGWEVRPSRNHVFNTRDVAEVMEVEHEFDGWKGVQKYRPDVYVSPPRGCPSDARILELLTSVKIGKRIVISRTGLDG
jgi:hypothetical protein